MPCVCLSAQNKTYLNWNILVPPLGHVGFCVAPAEKLKLGAGAAEPLKLKPVFAAGAACVVAAAEPPKLNPVLLLCKVH